MRSKLEVMLTLGDQPLQFLHSVNSVNAEKFMVHRLTMQLIFELILVSDKTK